MQLKKIISLLLAATLMVSPVFAQASTKRVMNTHEAKITANKAKKTVKSKTAKKSSTQKVGNETKKLYGVKGAHLKPTTVSNTRNTYQIKGQTYSTMGKGSSRTYSATGVASYYGAEFHGRKTANGERFDKNQFTAAHKTLALGSYALVTNLNNGRKVVVKINDRGPFAKSRILDVSTAAAKELGMIHSGVAKVRVEALQVSHDGYVSGKGTESLLKLAKDAGVEVKTRGSGDTLEVKAISKNSDELVSRLAE